MSSIARCGIFASSVLAVWLSQNVAADAAEADWGCQIVLCVAAQTPSWHGISYCVSPMEKLIAAMALPGFSWPACKAAGTGAPGFEAFEDCPSGYVEADDQSGHGGDLASYCAKYTIERGERTEIDRQPRPRRARPWYFDIRQKDGTSTRAWFDLQK
ncbi:MULTISPECIES: hypothetical protein [Rhizobium]|uniref:Uncharacterized protein n=1 Tax=Rhizobium tumorigenes TaxID=2041385 RepID=A0AAF1KDV4_9HYPH|nr:MULTISPECIES: hypothetical protein [Rhizobium]MBO9101977.1 hypothetical protein [Rhizobium sp. L58/93]MBO9172170.1 hypothetical protein [Rhizobium sp. L245/93]MBO9187910.1 hypothetical protein [Rhizobium sp. E27B/91]QXZ87543.1 hypothetical protein J5287_27950 [Rhizobium sp. K1/93]QXZ93583.1 hypothetical protein J5280_27950 [Rhizobium sp. K15/93]